MLEPFECQKRSERSPLDAERTRGWRGGPNSSEMPKTANPAWSRGSASTPDLASQRSGYRPLASRDASTVVFAARADDSLASEVYHTVLSGSSPSTTTTLTPPPPVGSRIRLLYREN